MSEHVEKFVGGDEIIVPFLIDAAGTIVDLSGCTVTVEVHVRGRLTADIATVSVHTNAPQPASGDGEQAAHGLVRIVEEKSELLPLGRVSFYRLQVVNSSGVTMHTERTWLERLQ